MGVNAGNVTVGVAFDSTQAAAALKGEMNRLGQTAGNSLNSGIGDKWAKLGTDLTRAGRQMTFGLTVPLLAAGRVAEKTFLDFEQGLTNIEGLVGVNHNQVQEWGAQILDTSQNFGVLGQDAVKALYLIASTGQKGQQAIDTLNTSMLASQAGLGEVKTLANISTSVMSAYGSANIDAAKAMDILTVATRDGKALPDEMAGAISRVIPVAAAAGVGFDQVAGAIASMTLSGANADEATTELRQILATLVGPSAQAKEAFASVGLSAAGLQQQLRSKGLLSTLEALTTAFEGNDDAITTVFGNIRAYTGVTSLLGEKTEDTRRILNDTANSTGAVAKAAEVASQSLGFKLKQSMADLNNQMIRIGDSVVPLVASFVEVGAKGAGAFASLPDPIKDTTVGLLAAAAATGPVLYTFGGLSRLAGGVGSGMRFVTQGLETVHGAAFSAGGGLSGYARAASEAAGAMSIATVGMGVGAAAAIALAIAYHQASDRAQEAAASFFKVAEAQQKKISTNSNPGGYQAAIDQINKYNNAIAQSNEEQERLHKGTLFGLMSLDDVAQTNAWKDVGTTAQKNGEELAKLVGQADAINERFHTGADVAFAFVAGQKRLGVSFEDGAKAGDAYNSSLGNTNTIGKAAASTIGNLLSKSQDASKSFFTLTQAQRGLEDAGLKVRDSALKEGDAARALRDVHRQQAEANDKVTDAERRWHDASRKTTDAINAQHDAQAKLNDLLNGQGLRQDQLDVEGAQLSLEEAKKRLGELGKDGQSVDAIDRKRAQLEVRRAQLDFERAQQEHGRNVAGARKDLETATRSVADAAESEVGAHKAFTDALRERDEFTYKVRDAENALTDAQRDHQRAMEDLAPAADTLAKAQAGVAAALVAGNNQAAPFIEYLTKLRDTYRDTTPEIADNIQRVIDKFTDLKNAQPAPEGQFNAPIDQFRRGEHESRAYGGPLGAGQLSTVNELGLPELWEQDGKQYLMPLRGGRVIPMKSLPSGSNGPALQTGDINIYETTNGRDTAESVRRELRKKAFLAGGR